LCVADQPIYPAIRDRDANVVIARFECVGDVGAIRRLPHGTNRFPIYHDFGNVAYLAEIEHYAKEYWGGAQYAMPYMMLFNLQGPSGMNDRSHPESPGFRVMWYMNTPTWLLSVMAKSGLFKDYLLKTSQVITWFYDSDIDGGFTYWPEGLLKQPKRLAAPMWNKGVVVQNEMMYHRGEPSGPRDKRDLASGFTFDTAVAADPDSKDGWQYVDNGKILRKIPHSEMRYLFHWSGEVFMDKADMKRRFDHLDDLSAERVFETLIADLRAKKIAFEVPSDPMTDRVFIGLLSQTYDVSPAIYPTETP